MADMNIADFAIFAVDLFGKDGGIKFNTCMVEHNDDLVLPKKDFQVLEKEQVIKIGEKGVPITKADIRAFLGKVQEYCRRDVFYNGRSYCFEGIEKTGANSYSIMWGS